MIIITSPGVTGAGSSIGGELALLAAAFSYACGAVYSRRNVRGLAPMIPAVFQVTFAAMITGTIALLFEHPWTATPDAEAIFSILWLGILGSGLAYLLVFRLFAHWGATRTTLVSYVIPVVGIVLGFLVLAEPIDARMIVGTALVIAGVGLVNSRFGGGACSGGCHRSNQSEVRSRARPAAMPGRRASAGVRSRTGSALDGLARLRPRRRSDLAERARLDAVITGRAAAGGIGPREGGVCISLSMDRLRRAWRTATSVRTRAWPSVQTRFP